MARTLLPCLRFGALVSSLLLLSAASGYAQSWVEAGPGLACDEVCKQMQSTAVWSGVHPSFGEYLVCSVDAGNQGYRPGYNLPAFAPDACITGYDGKEWFSPEGQTYLCLCR
jgi:hypothetical protein